MTNGHKWLQDTFDHLPASSWHVDPFGHSSVTPSLWSLIGFPGYAIARIPDIIKRKMAAEKGLEFVWRGSKSLGRYTEMWTHVLNPNYYPPAEMSFDDLDRGRSMEVIASECANVIREAQIQYKHNYRVITWGGDFSHQDGLTDFKNMDQLISVINNDAKFNMTFRYAFYSDYIKAVNELGLQWDVYEDDFYPYVEDPHTTWTGYYTSRPWFKIFLRQCDALLASTETLFALNGPKTSTKELDQLIETLRQATSVATHHDAVTGTETDETNKDYISNLQSAVQLTKKAATKIVQQLFTPNDTKDVTHYAVHNPLAWKRQEFVSMVTDSPNAIVTDSKGNVVPSQVNPVPTFSKVSGKYRLYFYVDLGPLSTAVYNVKFLQTPPSDVKVYKSPQATVTNSMSTLHFDSKGRLNKMTTKDGASLNVTMEYAEYKSTDDWSHPEGAYIFRPLRDTYYQGDLKLSPPKINVLAGNIESVVVKGPHINEVQQLHGENIGLTFIEYQSNYSKEYTEIVHEIGPLSTSGNDLIVRFNTSLDNDRVLFTDNNGLEIMKRKFNNDVSEPESANYYPMLQRVFIRDDKKQLQFNLMSDAGHGTGSIYNGQLEVMLHRRCSMDDGKGVNEVLDDVTPIRTTLRLSLSQFADATRIHRHECILQQFPPQLYPVQANGVVDGGEELPPNVHLMNVRVFRDNEKLVRLQHIYAAGEHPTLATEAVVDLHKFLSQKMEVKEIVETNLVGTIEINKMNKMQWKTAAQSPGTDFKPEAFKDGVLRIHPGEIRTFLVRTA